MRKHTHREGLDESARKCGEIFVKTLAVTSRRTCETPRHEIARVSHRNPYGLMSIARSSNRPPQGFRNRNPCGGRSSNEFVPSNPFGTRVFCVCERHVCREAIASRQRLVTAYVASLRCKAKPCGDDFSTALRSKSPPARL